MKAWFGIFIFVALLPAQKLAMVNRIEEVIVTPEVMVFKSADRSRLWTVQGLNRNYDIYNLTIEAEPDSVSVIRGIPVKYYVTDDSVNVSFSRWSTNIERETMIISDMDNYTPFVKIGLRDKMSMIAFLNRDSLPFIEGFFTKTFRVGSRQFKTSLDNPIDVIDYKENQYFFFQDRNSVTAVFPNRQFTISKSNYEWSYENRMIQLKPTADYIKNKRINAIKNGRSWYNNNWEKMRKGGKLNAVISIDGFNWNTDGLSDNEKNLLAWWQKS